MQNDDAATLDAFLYHITHDLRACFRALRTVPGWLREDLPPDAVTADIGEYLDILQLQAERGDRMLLDLREYSRVGRLSGDTVSTPVAEIAARCWARLSPPEKASLDCTAATAPLRMGSEDSDRLFTALLGNCLKHGGRADLEATVTATTGQAGTEIVITDNGPGIPPDQRERAFALLTTLRPRDECEGSGMGLTLARHIVRRAGGDITLGTPGSGAGLRVVIRLPPQGA
ncbi:MAG: sensor histidine kinase [Pseudooceanicola sp.]